MPLGDGTNLIRGSVIGVAHTRVVGRGLYARSIGIVQTSRDQPTDILLSVPFLYQGFNLVLKLETFNWVVPLVLVEFAVFSHVSSFHRGSNWARVAELVPSLHLQRICSLEMLKEM